MTTERDAQDAAHMRRALELAASAWGETSPNPMVGALVAAGSRVLGEGFHRGAGLPHAEPQALAAAAAASTAADAIAATAIDSVSDLTLYVSLEPCVHEGRTPPCVDAILRSPVRRVVVPHPDPDRRVEGRGVARLRDAGLRVDVGCLADDAAELNHVFIGHKRRGRPFVALKVALSADDCVAGPHGQRVAITGPAAQRHVHWLRAGHDAILVGVETLARDRPRLDHRLHRGPGRAPRRVVIDPGLRADPTWLWPGEEPRPLVFCGRAAHATRSAGYPAELVPLPEHGGGLDPAALVDGLGARGLWSVLVEGGGDTHRRFLEAGLWDRLWRYRNPTLRLAGTRWSAAAAWASAVASLGSLGPRARVDGVDLDQDRLEVFAHPAARLAG